MTGNMISEDEGGSEGEGISKKPASPHIVVHMGFHKTGTTSLQGYIYKARIALRRRSGIYVVSRHQLAPVLARGREFGQMPSLWMRLRFRFLFRKALNNIPKREKIIISREEFSGIIPGHRRFRLWRSYSYGIVARILAKEVVREVSRRFGKDAKITLVYTAREQEAWIRSVWGHVLRTTPLTIDCEEFARKMRKKPSLGEQVEKIAKAVAPHEVRISYLEDTKDSPFGPASAVLEVFGLSPRFARSLPPIDPRYPGDPPHLREKFLELNRSMKDKNALYDLKQELREEWITKQKNKK